MAKYDELPVPRGTSRRWEVLMSAEEALPRPADERRRTAGDVRAEHRVLGALAERDLASIPLLPEGQRLLRLRHYLDLHDPGRAAFVAEGDERVEPGQHVVAREEVSAETWDELVRACDAVLGRGAWRRLRPAV
jgi:hypothetical protein